MAKENNNNSATAENLFAGAFLANSKRQLEESEKASPHSEEGRAALRKAIQSLSAFSDIIEQPGFQYPRLTAEENRRLRYLEDMEFSDIDPDSDSELRRLRDKAWNVSSSE